MEPPPADALFLDEEPLRKAVLKGYFGDRVAPLEPVPLIAQLRELLSGAPGAPTEPTTYRFEVDPEASIPLFLAGIDAECKGLARLIVEPILSAAEEMASGKRKEIAPNLAVFVSSLAGSIAVKAKLSEAEAGALLAGFLLVVSRLGPSRTKSLSALHAGGAKAGGDLLR